MRKRRIIKTYAYKKEETILLIQFSNQNNKLSRRVIRINSNGSIEFKRWATLRKRLESLEKIVENFIKIIEKKKLKGYVRLSEKEEKFYEDYIDTIENLEFRFKI